MGSDEAAHSEDLAARLRPTLTQLHFMIRRRTPGPELTPSQQSVLSTLMASGPIRMGELARRERIRLPSTTSAVDGLERLGLVERATDPTDRRAVVVQLSASGVETTRELTRARNAALAGLLDKLSPTDRASLDRAIDALDHLAELYRSEP
ncbi:MarR family transcriptional regulator [Tsukamurella sp. 8F]|uniref:MarR family winged helix-turn-helix transcriptional regulator n=1 Tax=unclassified Tsukamurella TaxID=2633480 RepID=UPI0023B9F99E|nr:MULTISPECIES: MarR family transcriptional regulator [unclassified Tsukamurella]MDF0529438.1 MarR family transcriptional regulator [Tsukamurella sp. 8J]MDF0589347.1 MarR family transcriptional regulator [Tsukamurella sp. 8F]